MIPTRVSARYSSFHFGSNHCGTDLLLGYNINIHLESLLRRYNWFYVLFDIDLRSIEAFSLTHETIIGQFLPG